MSAHGLDDALLAATCEHAPNVAATHSGTSDWANALTACIDGRGGHATVERKTDLASGATIYSVRWPANRVTIDTSTTEGNVTIGSGTTINEASSAP